MVVTGGASFIGSHLVDALLEFDAHVLVLDNFSSGKRENLSDHQNLKILAADLENVYTARGQINTSMDFVFHLAAVHGGRGFIERERAAMLENFALDFNVFSAAAKAKVTAVVNASSACSYPVGYQDSTTELNLLSEDMANFTQASGSFPDGTYGWIKLMGEFQLATMSNQGSFRGRSARIFTAYGERENESHAAIALIAKSLLKLDPFPIWGDGKQTRNFTYVGDTVTGLLLAGADTRSVPFDVFNIGTSQHVTVLEFVRELHKLIGWTPSEFNFDLSKPTGVASRASDNKKISSIFGWQPEVDIREGIRVTLDWYQDSPGRVRSLEDLNNKLESR